MFQGRRAAITLITCAACAVVGLVLLVPAGGAVTIPAGRIIEIHIVQNRNPLVHVVTDFVKRPKPGELRVIVTNKPEGTTENSRFSDPTPGQL